MELGFFRWNRGRRSLVYGFDARYNGLNKKIKVLIVDDSALVRQTLQDILSSDPLIEIMATAADPLIAAQRLREEVPDVITLDVEMPRGNLAFTFPELVPEP